DAFCRGFLSGARTCTAQRERGQRLPAGPFASIGGAKGDRTPDLYNAIVALSQLSYGPETPGGRRYKSRSARWQPQLAIAFALVVLDLDLDLLGLIAQIVGILQRLVVGLQIGRLLLERGVLHLLVLLQRQLRRRRSSSGRRGGCRRAAAAAD